MKAKHAFAITTQVEITLALENAVKRMQDTIAKLQDQDERFGTTENAERWIPFWQERLSQVQAALAEFNDAKIDA